MNRRSHLLLGVALLFSSLFVLDTNAFSAVPSSLGHLPGPPVTVVTHDDVTTCQFTTDEVFDTQWNTQTVPIETLQVSSFNYPWGTAGPLNATDYSAGDYFGFVENGSGNYKEILYDSGGTPSIVLNTSGSFKFLGPGFLLYLGNGNFGTLVSDVPYTLGGSAVLPINIDDPTDTDITDNFTCPGGAPPPPPPTTLDAPGTPVAITGDATANVGWTAPSPSGNQTITGYTVNATDVTEATDDIADACPSSDTDTDTSCAVTGLNNGDTYTFTVAAIGSAGPGTYSEASNSVTPSAPTIDNIPSSAFDDGTFIAAFDTTSDGVASATSTTPAVCSASGTLVNFVGVGICTLSAQVAPTDDYLSESGSPQSFRVNAAAGLAVSTTLNTSGPISYGQAVSFQVQVSNNGPDAATNVKLNVPEVTNLSNVMLTSSAGVISNGTWSDVLLAANSTQLVVVSGTINAPGPFALSASVSAATYDPGGASSSNASGNAERAVPKTPSITDIPGSNTYGDSFVAAVATNSDGALTVTSSTPDVCAAAGLTVRFVGAGTCTLLAQAADGVDYLSASGSAQSFTVKKAVPSIPTITNLPPSAETGGSFIAAIATTSHGIRSLSSSSPTICTANGLKVDFVSVGTCTLTAQVAASSTQVSFKGPAQSFSVSTSVSTTTSTTTTTTTTTTLPSSPTGSSTTSNPPSSSSTTTTSPSDSTTSTTSATSASEAGSSALKISLFGGPGWLLRHVKFTVRGLAMRPGATVTIVVHSSPAFVTTTMVDSSGSFSYTEPVPSTLAPGVHHIIVTTTLADGSNYTQAYPFTVVAGEKLGSLGWVPPGPLANDIQFVPSSHHALVLATTAGTVVALASLGTGMGGSFGGGRTGGGGAGRSGAYLEDVELEREEEEFEHEGSDDRFTTWRWPGTKLVDRFSKHFPRRVAAVSPVVGRIVVDGDYLRATFGTGWLFLCLAAVGLGAFASSSTGWYAVPPTLGLFLAILGVSVLDATLGFLAGGTFLLCAAAAGHVMSADEVRLGCGLALVWFAVPLAAAALRPLRRTIHFDLDSIWERAADFAIGGLFAAWVALKMTAALSPLAGVELPISHDVNTVGIFVLIVIGVRIAIETFVAHHFPRRLAAVHHDGELDSSNLQVGASLVIQIATFIFISLAILGSNWALYVGALVFFTPLAAAMYADRFPKSSFVTRWKPNGLLMWAVVIVLGILLSRLLDHVIANTSLVEEIGFIVLPVPILIFWTLELFEIEDEDEEGSGDGAESPSEDEIDTAAHAERGENEPSTTQKWITRFAGLGLLAVLVVLVVTHVAGD